MLFSTLFALALGTGSALAANAKGKKCDISKLELILPENQTALAQPTGPATAVLLGVGYQNYTCSAEGKYTAAGAVADLFDLSCLSKNKNDFDTVEDKAYDQWIKTKSPKWDPKGCGKDVPFVGYHFFQPATSGTGISPVWDMRKYTNDGTAYVVAARVAGLPAPDGTGKNVDWLQLKGVEGAMATSVYRTETRGGPAPPSCNAGVSPPFQVKYTTKYWLYGGLKL
jgi:hypothetical protein